MASLRIEIDVGPCIHIHWGFSNIAWNWPFETELYSVECVFNDESHRSQLMLALILIPKVSFIRRNQSNIAQRTHDELITSRRFHDDVIKWKHFLRYWPFVRGIHKSPVNSLHKGQWRGALMFSLICALNKRLSKQEWGWWFEMPSRSLWRHCNVGVIMTLWLRHVSAGSPPAIDCKD